MGQYLIHYRERPIKDLILLFSLKGESENGKAYQFCVTIFGDNVFIVGSNVMLIKHRYQ